MSDLKDISQVIDGASEEYNKASFKVIRQLQEKVSKLEAENESLKHLLEQNTPSLINVQDLGFGINNQELICETQITLLKDAAINRALTMEEVRKLEILNKVLANVKSVRPDPDSLKVEKLSDADLVKAVLVV